MGRDFPNMFSPVTTVIIALVVIVFALLILEAYHDND